MRYLALVCDYDGTLAEAGQASQATLEALDRLLASGRRLILVTGRESDDLRRVFPHLHLFERVVAENGALLYRPASGEEKVLGYPPPEAFTRAIRQRGIEPLSCGRVIVSTWHPHETAVLEVIRDLGLELQVIFNKGAVMVLPAGINKASGLRVALRELGLSPHNVVGIGDAENDHAFLRLCECSVAVANALEMLKEDADFVTSGADGSGVVELISALVADELTLSQGLSGMLLLTVHPAQVAPSTLSAIDTVIVVGESPEATLRSFHQALGQRPPQVSPVNLEPGEAMVWLRQQGTVPFRLRIAPSHTERLRHQRKYAEGELGPDKSFYFRGSERQLNLRAQNLVLFMQLAEGIDDTTWTYHLRRGDYSRWFRQAIKDDRLADEAARIEERTDLSASESRARIKAAIEQHYTLPAAAWPVGGGGSMPIGRKIQ
ncbi:MAG: HAD family hydrolase [Candidatus Entotheonellia bacterium]